ncbi:baseplate assembly protein [Rouxiella sp. Mn2063]|uniref:baseplate assembly protein n=1 Tax=Rouxiella sp. Mn2063 TaxID=3395262 RepID=UPI003BED2964
MATSLSTINLSSLPVPDIIDIPEPTALFQTWLTRLRELDTIYDALVESDPVFKQGEVNAYQTTLLMQRVNDAVRAVLLSSATGNDLNQIGAGFNVPRLVIAPAQPDAVPPVDAVMESDDAYRERIQLSWSQLNTAGARNAYRFHAQSADPDVLDVGAYGPEIHNRAGEVDIYVLARSGSGQASEALLAKVYAALSEDETRPLTDYVWVQSAALTNFTVDATLEIPDGPDAQTVLDRANTELKSYLQQMRRVGGIVPVSGIYHALHQSGVSRVHLNHPTSDIEGIVGAVPNCTAINVGRIAIGGIDV